MTLTVKLKLGSHKNPRFATDEEIRLIKELFPNTSNREIARILDTHLHRIATIANALQLKKAPNFFTVCARRSAAAQGKNFYFEYEKYKEIRELYNIDPAKRLYVSETKVFIRGRGQKKSTSELLHNFVWRAHHGDIPKGFFVFAKDGNFSNCRIENLALISASELYFRKNPHKPQNLRPCVWFDSTTKNSWVVVLRRSRTQAFRIAAFILKEEAEAFVDSLPKSLLTAEHLPYWEKYQIEQKQERRASRTLKLSDEQAARLVELFPETTISDLTRLFGCQRYLILKTAAKLNLKKAPFFRPLLAKQNYSAKQNYPANRESPRGLFGTHYDLYQRIRKINGFSDDVSFNVDRGQLFILNVEQGKRIKLHNYLWRMHFGEIPKNHLVSYKDGNSFNCQIENLELITFSEHLYRRTINQYPGELKPVVEALNELKKAIREQPKKVGGSRYNTRTHSPWTDEEVLFLKNNYRRLSNVEISRKLNRPVNSITTAAFRLELTNRRGCGRRLIWTDEKIQTLKNDYYRLKGKKLAALFGCSIVTVRAKARELGINRKYKERKKVSEVRNNAEK